ncbi:MAG: hypothetical protein KIS94_10505 [Chitinophagales bacterium]|nr:hypothetical protein [Chitinophagales bacterium]
MRKAVIVVMLLSGVVVALSSLITIPEKISPMAKLMRDMLKFVKEERVQIEAGKEPLPFPKNFERIKTAKVTPGKKPAKDHEQYLTSFLTELNAYYKAKDINERKQSLNILINTCIACHEEECPGPIQTIKTNRF